MLCVHRREDIRERERPASQASAVSVYCVCTLMQYEDGSLFELRPLTEREVVMRGLMGQAELPNVEVKFLGPSKGRGVVVKEPIKKGTFVAEYKTYRVYALNSDECAILQAEYNKNYEGSYVIQTAHIVPAFGACVCFDATRRYTGSA